MKSITLVLILVFLLGCSNNQNVSEVKFTDKKEYYLLRGMNYVENKDYEKALQELKKALEKDSSNLIVNREIGFCYSAMGDYEKGEYYYKKVLSLESEDINALKNLSYIYYQQNNLLLSQKMINSIPKNGKDDYVNKLQGYIYIKNNEDDKAYNCLKKEMAIGREFDLVLYKKYFLLLNKMNKKEELYILLEKKYNLFKDEKEYIKIYIDTLDTVFDKTEKSKKVIKRYLISNKDDELLLKLVELDLKTKDYKNAKTTLSFISEEGKFSEKYIELEKIISINN